MQEQDWRQYRRRLPHWRTRGATYFVTWRVHPKQTELTPAERTEIVRILSHFRGSRYQLPAYVVMNDHVHVLVTPHEGWRLEQLIHSWKSFSAHVLQREYGRSGSVWLGEYQDRIVRDEYEFEQKLTYIGNNPVKRWPKIEQYEWVGVDVESCAAIELDGRGGPPH